MSFTISRTIQADFDATIERTAAALKSEGFGILTDIDVKETMKPSCASMIFRVIEFSGPAIHPSRMQRIQPSRPLA